MQVGMQGDFGAQRAWNVVLGRSVCSISYCKIALLNQH
jgi:hypothetical protein